MKKFILIGAFLCSLFALTTVEASYYNRGYGYRGGRGNWGFSGNYSRGYGYGSSYGYGSYGYGADGCCASCDQPTGQCYCQYVTYKACPYTIKRCVEEQYTCPRRCCRMVPQYYDVQKCRMVPEYYTVQCCRQVPEYYEVQDCKTCKRIVCEPACEYIPQYYWKCECKPACPSCP